MADAKHRLYKEPRSSLAFRPVTGMEATKDFYNATQMRMWPRGRVRVTRARCSDNKENDLSPGKIVVF